MVWLKKSPFAVVTVTGQPKFHLNNYGCLATVLCIAQQLSATIFMAITPISLSRLIHHSDHSSEFVKEEPTAFAILP